MNSRDPVTKEDLELTERDENGISKTYFPIKIRYDGDCTDTTVDHPNNIRDMIGFVVKQTRVGQ